MDCYEGHGGDPIQPDPHSYDLSLSDCQAACAADISCEGIITRVAYEGGGLCYKKKNLVLSDCVRDPKWDLFIKAGTKGNT